MPRPTPEEIGVIMLAAGQSRRFDGDKRLALMPDGRTLLESSLDCVPASLNRRLLVLHPGDDYLASRFGNQWEILIARQATKGMGESLASAVRHLLEERHDWQGALIALGDMPAIGSQTFTRLQNALCESPVVVPHYQGRRGHPVGFQRRFFEELSRLRGDSGARELLRRHADDCHAIYCDDAGIIHDIDTRDAMLERLDAASTPGTGGQD